MDIVLFRYLNSLAGHGTLIDGVIVFLASYLQYVLGGTLVVLALRPRRRRMAIAAFISAFAARLVFKPVILLFVHRARPFVALPDAHNLVGTSISENLQSFPSGHALFFFALAMGVYRYDKKLGWWFFAGATLMGLARVAAGAQCRRRCTPGPLALRDRHRGRRFCPIAAERLEGRRQRVRPPG